MELAEKSFEIGRGAEQVLESFLFDAIHQGDEQIVSLVFVFDQRIFLALSAQTHAFAQGIHGVKVSLPLFVDRDENHAAFFLIENLQRQVIHSGLVGFFDLADEEVGDRLFVAGGEIDFFGSQAHRQGGVHPVEKFVVVLGVVVATREVFVNFRWDGFLDDFVDQIARSFGAEHFVAVAVNDFALFVHHVIEIQNAFPTGIVPLFDPFLCGFNRAVEPGMFQRFAFLHAEPFHHRGHPIGGGEVPHQIVFERDEELRATWIALAGAAAAELAVGAAGFVAFGADDVKSAEFSNSRRKFDIRSPARHVGRNGDRSHVSGAGNDFGFLLVEFGVEDGVRNLRTLEHPGERFRRFHRSGADENRLALAVGFFDFLNDGVEFFATGFENLVVFVDSLVGPVRWNRQDVEAIDVVELCSFGFGGTGHAGEFFVKPEVVLDGDRGEGLGFLFDGDPFFRFNGLVQTVRPTAAWHFAAGVVIHDDHLVVFDHVLNVFFEDAIGFEKLGNVVDFLGLGVHADLFGLFGGEFLLLGEIGICVDVGEERAEVGKREGFRIARRKELAAFFHQVGIVAFFVDGEVELFFNREEILFLRVLVEGKLGLFEQTAHFRIFHVAHQLAVARLAEFDFEKCTPGTDGVAGFQEVFRFRGEVVAELGLTSDELFDQRFVGVVLV